MNEFVFTNLQKEKVLNVFLTISSIRGLAAPSKQLEKGCVQAHSQVGCSGQKHVSIT